MEAWRAPFKLIIAGAGSGKTKDDAADYLAPARAPRRILFAEPDFYSQKCVDQFCPSAGATGNG
jgi:hypothetical protein